MVVASKQAKQEDRQSEVRGSNPKQLYVNAMDSMHKEPGRLWRHYAESRRAWEGAWNALPADHADRHCHVAMGWVGWG